MSVILYHFCAARHRKNILYAGLRIGGVCVPMEKGYHFYSGYIWLTTDPDADNQSWATRNIVKYDRTAYRCAVEIPDACADKIMDRDALDKLLPGSYQLFDEWEGSENWRVFRGMIPPEWITRIERARR